MTPSSGKFATWPGRILNWIGHALCFVAMIGLMAWLTGRVLRRNMRLGREILREQPYVDWLFSLRKHRIECEGSEGFAS